MMKSILFDISLWKTLYFNFHYFGINGVIHCPVIVSKNVILKECSGGATLESFRFANVRIGFDGTGICDFKYQRGIWYLQGDIYLGENVRISSGVKISCSSAGQMYFGKNVSVNVNSQIICMNSIYFGENTMISWDDLIMDSDFHAIESGGIEGQISKPIYISKNVWIGCRVSLFKGTHIEEGCIVAANSTIRGTYEAKNSLITTSGVARNHVYWKR